MEDPSKILDQSVADMGRLVKLRQAVAMAIAVRRLKIRLNRRIAGQNRYRRAELALKGEEDLAGSRSPSQDFQETATSLSSQVQRRTARLRR